MKKKSLFTFDNIGRKIEKNLDWFTSKKKRETMKQLQLFPSLESPFSQRF